MADPNLPFADPNAPQALAPQQQGPNSQDIAGQWNSFLSQPGAGQFMLGMGINLMQPRHFGDTFASQLGRAIGAGAEGATAGEIGEAKVGELEARGRSALERSAYAGERIGLQQMVSEQKARTAAEAQQTQVYKAYLSDLDNAEKRHQAKMTTYLKEKGEWDLAPAKTRGAEPQRPPALPPRPPFQEWLRVRYPQMHDRMFPAGQQKPAEKPAQTETET